MKEQFIAKRFSPDSLALIQQSNAIIAQYQAQGYDLSLRQLYYQHVSRNTIPNSERSYKRLGSIINDARLAGLVDWSAIKDRGRVVVSNPHWSSPKSILQSAARSFAIDKWLTQPYHVEVAVEKQALEGVLVPVCAELDVPFTANKGYSSASHMYEASKRLLAAKQRGQKLAVLYLGDHDPSGLDMTRDVFARLSLFVDGIEVEPEACEADEFVGFDHGYVDLSVRRLALNMDQIEQYNPPENPAKTTDSRSYDYIRNYGESSWELDALRPDVLANLVRDAVASVRDEDAWAEAVAKEAQMIAYLDTVADEYEDEE